MSVGRGIAIVVGLAVVGALAYAVLEPIKVFGVTATGLEGSITREFSGASQEPDDLECEELEGGNWRCGGERFGNLDVQSKVAVDDEGCWQIKGSFDGAFKKRTGCIGFRDAIGSPF